MPLVTKTQLENAAIDCATLEHVVNDDATPGTVTSRLGTSLLSLAKIIDNLSTQDIGAGAAALINGRIDDLMAEIGDGIGYDDLLLQRADNSNVFPDPFFTDTTLSGGYIDGLSPFAIRGAWTSLSALSSRKYRAGKVLIRPVENVTLPQIMLSLDKLGLVSGDTIQIVVEARYTGSFTTTSGTFMYGEWVKRDGSTVGSAPNIITVTTDNPMSATLHTFTSGNLTIPTDAGGFRISAGSFGTAAGEWAIESFQVVKGSIAAAPRPVQNFIPANLNNRLNFMEESNPASLKNSLLLRRTTYSSLSVARALGGASVQAAFSGYGQSYLASVCPSGGFNAIRQLWKWELTSGNPSRIYVGVTTSATGKNPLNAGKLLATGFIDVDPESGNAGNEPIQLFGLDGLPKTIVPGDLLDLVGLYFTAVQNNGVGSSILYVNRGANAYTDPALPVYQIPNGAIGNGIGDGFTANIGAAAWSPDLLLLTNPVSGPIASAKLAKSVATKVAEQPDLVALPKKMWCIVGKPTWIQYATVQCRDHRTTGFSSDSTSSISKNMSDGFIHTPSSAGSVNINLQAEANGVTIPAKTVAFSSIAASTGAGTARFLMLGDSMTANGSMQGRLNALAVGDVTSVVNMGTQGADPVKNEGYSGQQNGIFFTPGNAFYNAAVSDFDFAYYMTNLGVANPTHVLLASGFWHIASATSDAEVAVNAAGLISQFERMITSIHTHSSTIKVGIWTQPVPPYEGQDGESTQITPLSNARRRRNAILLGAAMIEQFSGREGSKIYSVATGQTSNPDTAYPRTELIPVDRTIEAKISTTTYANYAALTADLTPGDGTISLVGGSRYYVKVWGTGTGHWRPVIESDGFIRRVTDSVHPSGGYSSMGDLVWAWIKATMA